MTGENEIAEGGDRDYFRYLIFALLVVGSAFSFLFSPPPVNPEDTCGWYVEFAPGVGYNLNCDSRHFVQLAQEPSRLFTPDEVRQGRPLYIIAGSVMGSVISIFAGGSVEVPHHWGYVVINFALMFGCLLLFNSILSRAGVDKSIILMTAVFLVSNNVIKTFIWSPHLQMLALFTPVFTIYIGLRTLSSNKGFLRESLVCFFCGFLVLAYGNFLAVLPLIVIIRAYRKRINEQTAWKYLILASSVLGVLFFIPTLLWVVIVTLKAGHYFNHEMADYRQYVWMFDELAKGLGPFISAFLSNTLEFGKTFINLEVLPFIILAICIYIFSVKKKNNDEEQGLDSHVSVVSLLTFALVFLMFWPLGYYAERLTFSIVPPLLIFIAIKLEVLSRSSEKARKGLTAVILTAAACWHLIHLFQYGPFK
jgi:hypothetical protein